MKLLFDQGLPLTAAAILRSRGYDTVHTGEVGLAMAEYAEILAIALYEGRVVITLDADFHALLAVSGASSPSVIRIHIERLRAEAVADLVQKLIEHWGALLEKGVVLTVQPGRVRIHHLPILQWPADAILYA